MKMHITSEWLKRKLQFGDDEECGAGGKRIEHKFPTKVIDFSKDFSRYAWGRYRSDGEFSGQRFREELLRPVLDNQILTEIKFTDECIPSSGFLEEAFGGLIRDGYSYLHVMTGLRINTDDHSLITEIREYIQEANQERINAGLSKLDSSGKTSQA